MPVDMMTRSRLRQPGHLGQPDGVYFDAIYGRHVGTNEYRHASLSLHSRQSSVDSISKPRSVEMASSPGSAATGPSPSGSRIGRPPQWTVSRSRKLARLYLYSTLSIEKIIKVLENDGFKPRCATLYCPTNTKKLIRALRKNSAQKTIHKMLDNDPRYLRPESRVEMTRRINSLCSSPTRRRRRKRASIPHPREAPEPMLIEVHSIYVQIFWALC